MQVDTVDVSPESANHMIVSLNGVIQKPTDAYTVAGSTITFASALETGDVIDFIQILGNVLDLGVPSDNTVTTAKLSDSSVTTAKLNDASVTTAKLNDASVTTAKLNDASVTTAKLNDASVSLAKLTATGTKDATTFLRGDNTFAAAGGGKVLQVLTATDTTERSTSSTSFVTASNTLTITITPSAASSKIFLVTSGTGYQSGSSSKFTIYRGATNLSTASSNELVQFEANRSSIGMTFLDSPNTTSATTYQVYFRNPGGSTTNLNPNDNQSIITAFEIGA
jgi:uncharacterized protein YjbI with pentapeptide repeats